MSTHSKEKIEKIEEIISQLSEEANRDKLIVVEGKKDEKALMDLGINGRILTLKTGGKSFLQGMQQIEAMHILEVILLLDFDRRGKEGTKRLLQDLEHLRIRANVKWWSKIRGLIGHEVQCIESLPSYLKKLREKTSPI